MNTTSGHEAKREVPIPTLSEIFFGKVGNWCRKMRDWRKHGLLKKGHQVKRRRQAARLEMLEPRLLLSADLIHNADAAVALDASLQIADVEGVSTLQLVDNGSGAVLGERALDQDVNVTINGSDFNDRLVIDFDSSAVPYQINVAFDGGAGDDTLRGPADGAVWSITGTDSGNMGDVSFGGVENLEGAADNEDTFVIGAGGSVSGLIEGGAGGFDSIVVSEGGYSSMVFRPSGPDSGTITLDGAETAYAGFEPITVDGVAPDIVLDLTDVAGATATLKINAVTVAVDDYILEADDGAFESHTFVDPGAGNAVTINLGAGNDTITLKDLRGAGPTTTLDATLTVSGGAGDDTFKLDDNWGVGVAIVEAAGGGTNDKLDFSLFSDSAPDRDWITILPLSGAITITGEDPSGPTGSSSLTLNSTSAANFEDLTDANINLTGLAGSVENRLVGGLESLATFTRNLAEIGQLATALPLLGKNADVAVSKAVDFAESIDELRLRVSEFFDSIPTVTTDDLIVELDSVFNSATQTLEHLGAAILTPNAIADTDIAAADVYEFELTLDGSVVTVKVDVDAADPTPTLSGGGTIVTVGIAPAGPYTVAQLQGAINSGLTTLSATSGVVAAAERDGRLVFQVIGTEIDSFSVEGLAGAALTKLGFASTVPVLLSNVQDVLRDLGELNLSIATPVALNVGLESGAPKLRFDVDYRAARESEFFYNLGAEAQSLGLAFDLDARIIAEAELVFDFQLGLDVGDSDVVFFLDVDELRAGISITAEAVSGVGLDIGFLSASVSGELSLDAGVVVNLSDTLHVSVADLLADPDAAGGLLFGGGASLDLTGSDGTGSPAFDLSLTITVAAGLGLVSATGTLDASGNPFDGSDITIGTNTEFQNNLFDFNNMNAAGVVSLLGEVSGWLDGLRDSELISSINIPFVEGALDGVLDIAEVLSDALLYDEGPDDVRDGADKLVTDLNAALGDAGLGAQIRAQGNGSSITFMAIDPEITAFTISKGPGDDDTPVADGFEQLGIVSGAIATTVDNVLRVVGSAGPIAGKLAGNAVIRFNITRNAVAANTDVTVEKAATDDNTGIGDDEAKLLDVNNAATFTTAQGLVDRLKQILTFIPDDVNYNVSTKILTYDVEFSDVSLFTVELPTDFSLDLSPIGSVQSDTRLVIDASGGIHFTLGFDLNETPTGSSSLTDTTTLDSLDVDVKLEEAATAQVAPVSIVGQLSGDANFEISINGDAPIPVSVVQFMGSPGDDINVTQADGNQRETTIAVNPVDPDNIIVAPNDHPGIFGDTEIAGNSIDDDGDGDIDEPALSRDSVWVTTDGGVNWDRKVIPLPAGGDGGHGDPTIAFSRDGSRVVYVHMVDKSIPDHLSHVMASAVSLDGGVTWLDADTGVIGSLAADADGDGFDDAEDKEFLAVGPDVNDPTQDRFAVAWQRNGVIYFSSSTDGLEWIEPVVIGNLTGGDGTTQPSGNGIDSNPTFGPNGEIYVVWQDTAVTGVSRIMFDVSFDGGLTWGGGEARDDSPPRLLTFIQGLDTTISSLEPPDTHLAVGEDHVIEVVNNSIGIYDKSSGAHISTQSLSVFFSDVVTSGTIFDPVVAFDAQAERFIVLALEGSGLNNRVLYAVSDTADPTQDGADGDADPFTEMHSLTIDPLLFTDYPKIGWNADAHVFSFNMFDNSDPEVLQRVDILAIDKSTVLDADDGTFTYNIANRLITDFTLAPATMHDAVSGDPMWFVEAQDDGSTVRVVRMDDVLDISPTFTDFVIDVADYGVPPAAAQPGGTFDAGDTRMLNAEMRGNRLVATHVVGLGGDATARWYEFDVSGATPTLTQQGNVDGGAGVDTYYPSIAIAPNGDLGLTFMQSSSTEFVSMYVTGQKEGDVVGTMRTPTLVQAGTSMYTGTRGGDYSGIAVDPVTGGFWAANEVVVLTGSDNWSTAIAEFVIRNENDTTILFATGNATLDAADTAILDEFADRINGDPTLVVTIEGHTDTEGGPLGNQTLSDDRASAVYTYLTGTAGVAASRLTVLGFGESQLAVQTADGVALQANRRVDLTVDRVIYTGNLNVFNDPFDTDTGGVGLDGVDDQYEIPAQPDRPISMGLSIIADRSGGANDGRIYLAFTDQGDLDGDPDAANDTDHHDTDVFVLASDNSGATWIALGVPPVRVNDDAGDASQFFSWIGVDQATGNVAVSWYDARNDADATPNNEVEYFAAFSTDGGANWSDNIKVSDGVSDASAVDNIHYGDYTGLVFLNNTIHMTWTDNSNSTLDNPGPLTTGVRNTDVYYDRIALGNATIDDLLDDINAAIDGTALAGRIEAQADGNRVKLVALDPTVDSFTVSVASNADPAFRDLGFQLSADAEDDGSGTLVVEAAKNAPTLVGQLTADASFSIDLGSGAVTVTVPRADTISTFAPNRNILDLISDVQHAVDDALGADMIEVSSEGGRLLFTRLSAPVLGTSDEFTIAPISNADELGITGTLTSDEADLVITVDNGSQHRIVLDGVTTIGGVISAINATVDVIASKTVDDPEGEATPVNEVNTGLTLVDDTAGVSPTGNFKVSKANGSLAGIQLGLIATDTNPQDDTDVADGKIVGAKIAGATLLDRFFITADDLTHVIEASIEIQAGRLVKDIEVVGVAGDVITSGSFEFKAEHVGMTLAVKSVAGFTAGDFTIDAVDETTNQATLSASVGADALSDGVAILETGVEASANFGFVGIDVTGPASLGVELSLGFNENADEFGDNKLTLQELINGLDHVLDLFALPDIQPIAPETDFGSLDLTVALTAGSVDFSALTLLGGTPTLTIDVAALGDPFIDTRFAQAGYNRISATQFEVDGDFTDKLLSGVVSTGASDGVDSSSTILHTTSATAEFTSKVEVGDHIWNVTENKFVVVTAVTDDFTVETEAVGDWSGDDYAFFEPLTLRFDDGTATDVEVTAAEFDTVTVSKTRVTIVPPISSSFDLPVNGLVDGVGDDDVSIVLLPKVNIGMSGLGDLPDFSDLSFADIIAMLQALAGFLSQFESFGFLSTDLPIIDKSVNDLLGYADELLAAIEEAQNNPAGTLQILESKINEAIGIASDTLTEAFDAVGLTVDPDLTNDVLDLSFDDNMLILDFSLGAGFSQGLDVSIPGIDFGAGGPLAALGLDQFLDLSGSAGLEASGGVVLRLSLGVDVENFPEIGTLLDLSFEDLIEQIGEHIFILDTTGLDAKLTVGGEDIAFRVGVGPFALSIASTDTETSEISIAATAEAGLASSEFTDGKVSFTDFFASPDFDGSLTGTIAGTLPVFFPNDSTHIGAIRIGEDVGAGFGNLANIGSLFLQSEESPDPAPTTADLVIDVHDIVEGISGFNFDNFSLFDNIFLAIDGIDLVLKFIQDALDGQIGGFTLPLIGDGFSDAAGFINDLREDFIAPLREGIEDAQDAALDFADDDKNIISGLIFDLLGPDGLGLLKGTGDSPGGFIGLSTNLDEFLFDPDTDLTLSDTFIEWDMTLGSVLANLSTDIGFDLGIPGLGLETEGDITLDIEWELHFGFGLSFKDGFYLLIDDPHELLFDIGITLPAAITGTLGFLELRAQDKEIEIDGQPRNTELGATFMVDIFEESADPDDEDVDTPDDDDHLGFTEFGSIGLDAGIAAEASATLGLELGLSDDLFVELFGSGASDVIAGFPKVQADFAFLWEIGTRGSGATLEQIADNSDFISFGDIADAIGDGLKYVAFQDVGLDLGSFLSDVLGPLVEEVSTYTEPIQPIIDFIMSPIPIIGDLGLDITWLDLAAALAGDSFDVSLIESIASIITLINDIAELSSAGEVILPIGDMVIFDRTDLNPDNWFEPGLWDGGLDLGGTFDAIKGTSGLLDDLIGAAGGIVNALGDLGGPTADTLSNVVSGQSAGGFAFPFLDDPTSIFGLLMGEPVDLVTYDLGAFNFSFEFRQFFSIFGPLGVSIGLLVEIMADTAFGYDTQGIQDFVDSGFTNPGLLFNGFFISDSPKLDGNDDPELTFLAELQAAAELNLGIARAGVAAALGFLIEFDLFDPNNDMKIRFSELIGNFLNQLNAPSDAEKLLAPLAIFDVHGEIFARLFAFLEIDFGFFSFEKEFPIFGPVTLLSFDVDFFRPPILASEIDANGDLVIHTGEFADQRLLGNATDIGEHLIIQSAGTSGDYVNVQIKAGNGALGDDSQVFQNYQVRKGSRIIIDGGEGDDIFNLSGFVEDGVIFDIDLGVGNDQVIWNDSAEGVSGEFSTIRGGSGDDTIEGSGGSDLIFGDAGNDSINAGNGDDLVFGDEGEIGDNTARGLIRPSDGRDVIDGEGGEDIVFGGGGKDDLAGGGDDDLVIGGGGIATFNSPPTFPFLAPLSEGGVDDVESLLFDPTAGDTIAGGGGDDLLFGTAGPDVIDGGAGDDIIFGFSGFDDIDGGADDDLIFGDGGEITDDGPAPFSGGEKDTIQGGAGEDTIYGGGGGDYIQGGDDDDTIYGGSGADLIFGDNGHVMAGIVTLDPGTDGDDKIFGQGEPDKIYAGGGIDEIDGGAGNDTIKGGDDPDVITVTKSSDFIDGEEGSDNYLLFFQGGNAVALTTVLDTGDAADVDLFVVTATVFDDEILLRANTDGSLAFVALINSDVQVERINYSFVERIVVNGSFGDDYFASDDTAAEVTLNGEFGDDTFQIGQMFRSERINVAANVSVDDEFATIETTRGFLSNGISQPMTINGGLGNDLFTVFHNKAVLQLNGEEGDDVFEIRAFALAGSQEPQRERTDITGGAGADLVQYAVNAPVNINGGDGFDTVVVIGTEFGDDFVITEDGVFGAGLTVNFVNIESLRVDGAEGDDRFFVKSTSEKFLIEIFGGLGADTFNMSGDTPPIVSNDLKGHSGLIVQDVESVDPRFDGQTIFGISANVADNDEPFAVIRPTGGSTIITEGGALIDSYTIVLTRQPDKDVYIKALAPIPTPSDRERHMLAFRLDSATAFALTVDGTGLTLKFTTSNWYIPQTVNVYADAASLTDLAGLFTRPEIDGEDPDLNDPGIPFDMDDDAYEGVRFGVINHLVQAASTTLSALLSAVDNTDPVIVTISDPGGITAEDLLGRKLIITDGPGAGQSRYILGAVDNGATFDLTLDRAFTSGSVPDTTSEYFISIDDAIVGTMTSFDEAPAGLPAITDPEDDRSTFTDTAAVFPTAGQGLTGAIIEIIGGPGAGQQRLILGHVGTDTLILNGPWRTDPVAGESIYRIERYEGLSIPSVSVQINDNDRPGLIVDETTGFVDNDDLVIDALDLVADFDTITSLIEGGDGDHVGEIDVLRIRLSTDPGATDVEVGLIYDSIQLLLTDLAGNPIDAGNPLVFDGTNWSDFQPVLVYALTELMREGFHSSLIEFEISTGSDNGVGAQTDTFVTVPEDRPVYAVGLSFTPVAGTVNVTLNGVPLTEADAEGENGDFQVLSNQVIFVDAAGDLVTVAGDIEVEYDYVVPGFLTSFTAPVLARIGDSDAPTVLVRETGGSTDVIELRDGGTDPESVDGFFYSLVQFFNASPWNDSYELVLTGEPTDDVTVTVTPEITKTTRTGGIRHDAIQVEIFSDDLRVTPDGSGNLVVTFSELDWDDPVMIKVRALDDAVVDGSDTQVFAPGPNTVSGILGPVVVEGAGGAGSLAINAPLMLPGETNRRTSDGNVVDFIEGSGLGAIETMTVETADLEAKLLELGLSTLDELVGLTVEMSAGQGINVVLNDERPNEKYDRFWLINEVADAGGGNTLLTLQNPSQIDAGVFTPTDVPDSSSEYAITALSVNFFVDETTQVDFMFVHDEDSPADSTGVLTPTRLYGLNMGPDLVIGGQRRSGGITYGDLEVLEINLGKGNNDFTVLGTHTREDGYQTWTFLNTGDEPVEWDGVQGDTVTVKLNAEDVVTAEGIASAAENSDAEIGIFSTTVTIEGTFADDELVGQLIRILEDDASSADGQVRRIVGNVGNVLTLDRQWEFLPNGEAYEIVNEADGAFAVNTQGGNDTIDASASSLGIVAFGGLGSDTITGGSGADILFGDRGRVDYFNEIGAIVTRLGDALEPISGFVTTQVTLDDLLTIIDSGATFPAPDGLADGSGTEDIGLRGLYVDINNGFGFLQPIRLIADNDGTTLTLAEPFDGSLDLPGPVTDDESEYRISTMPEDQTDGVRRAPNLLITVDHNLVDPAGLGTDDVINAGAGDDQVFGGAGGDTITAGEDDDIVIGDAGHIDRLRDPEADETPEIGDVVGSFYDRLRTIEFDLGGVDTISGNAGADLILGGKAGDTIYGDDAAGSAGSDDLADVILGDNGEIEFVDGVINHIFTTDTSTTTTGANADTITGNAGDDIVLGGLNGSPDVISGSAGDDILLGDNGELIYDDAADPDLSTLDIVRLFLDNLGGGDTISGDAGGDMVLGGTGGDTIYGDNSTGSNAELDLADYVLGDNGEITLVNNLITRIETTDTTETTGGDDTISGNAAGDYVLGGVGSDTIHGDAASPGASDGDDKILGDNGIFEFSLSGGAFDGDPLTLDRIQTRDTGLGGVDTIRGNANDDVILGGTAGDSIYGNTGNDLVLGDFGDVQFGSVIVTMLGVSSPLLKEYALYATITDNALGGTDTIFGEEDEDVIAGGAYGDNLDGGSRDDLIFGDNVALDRRGAFLNDFTNPRFREQDDSAADRPVDGALYDLDGNVQAGSAPQNIPALTGTPVWGNWEITLVDHDDETENAAGGTNFGDDYIAGGAHDDQIFGQLGNDTIQGDGSIASKVDGDGGTLPVSAARVGGLLQVAASLEASSDGDDYIEGNGGNDVIFGNLGQDDIVGGNSDLFSLFTPDRRPDGSDMIFGGAGADILRNDAGDALHARDSDVILGDNGNIFRIVTGAGPDAASTYRTFSYDNDYGEQLIVRAPHLLDYTPGGILGAAPTDNIGAADELHGESGDDFIYGMKGDDVLFGEGQDDDLLGGYGKDWISGGAGDDGVLGDDGRISTSRNGTAEPLYGIGATTEQSISTPGNIQQALINETGKLKKTVNLTPFSVDPAWIAQADEFSGITVPHNSDDIIYGGLGNDSLHGGSGDDAISGAEALATFYDDPSNPGDVLGYSDVKAGEFALYDEFYPLRKIAGFLLNFNHTEGVVVDDRDTVTLADDIYSDGDDKIFGDLGNDWLVGGTGRDNIYGGWGDDLLNADDNHDSTNDGIGVVTLADLENNIPDTHASYEDRAYGGAGRDVLIGNTGGDRLIDWIGEFNSYLVPFAPFGMATVSRTLQPQLPEFLYALSASDGADPTRSVDTGAEAARNGEPAGELGLVLQKDFAWQAQTGAPDDPQAGNIPGGKRDVLRSASFDGASGFSGFFADSGVWAVQGGRLTVSAESLGGDAVAVFHVGDALPGYFEVQASISVTKPNGGWKANSYIVFDYQGEYDFKFTGLDISTNKLVMGHRDATGWIVDKQAPFLGSAKYGTFYNMLLAVNGVNAILMVDNKTVFTHTYQPRVVDGYSYGLNSGMVGVGSDNSRGSFDNIQVQVLPPQVTFDNTEDFSDGVANLFQGDSSGVWTVSGNRYSVSPNGATGMSVMDLGSDQLNANSWLELTAKVNAQGRAGFIFDRYDDGSFKFVAIDAPADKVIIGHYTIKSGWVNDAVISKTIIAGTDYTLGIALKNSTVSVTLGGQVVMGYAFNAATVDGNFGLMATGGQASFDDVRVRTDDQAFVQTSGSNMVAAEPALATTDSGTGPAQTELDAVTASAMAQWIDVLGSGNPMLAGLGGIQVRFGDLAGDALGYSSGRNIRIDTDAAGYGWSIDSAAWSGDAFGRMDLATVVSHEIGHVLGLDHDDVDSFAVMGSALDTGSRYALDGVLAGVSGSQTDDLVRATASTAASKLSFDFDAIHFGAPVVPGGAIDWGDAGGLKSLSPFGSNKSAKASSSNFSDFLLKLAGGKDEGLRPQSKGYDALGTALRASKAASRSF